MKRGVVSEAINKLPDEYKDEALELLNQADVSEITNMKSGKSTRKVVLIGVAAAMTLALGVSVAAANGAFRMHLRDAEPSEAVITYNYSYTDYDTGETVNEVIQHEAAEVITFESNDVCNEIEFRCNYHPEVYREIGGEFGEVEGWNSYLEYETDYGSIKVNVFYDSQFGEDGVLFFEEDLFNVEEGTIGEYDVYKFSDEWEVELPAEGWYDPNDIQTSFQSNYIVMHHPNGHILVISGTENMDVLEQVASNIEVRETGNTVTSEDFSTHYFYVDHGVG